jgi:hypothetical protein
MPGVEAVPYKDPEKKRAHYRRKYAEEGREWGKITAVCPRCQGVRELSKNSYKITTYPKDEQGRIVKRCIKCAHFLDGTTFSHPENETDVQREKRRELKRKYIQYKGGECEDCGLGYDGTNGAVFDFHHVGKKNFQIGQQRGDWETVKAELDACDLLCCGCHRIRHAGHY